MGTLQNHNTQIPTTGLNESIPNAATSPKDSGGKHHKEPQASRSEGGSGSNLPDGTLDTSRSPQI